MPQDLEMQPSQGLNFLQLRCLLSCLLASTSVPAAPDALLQAQTVQMQTRLTERDKAVVPLAYRAGVIDKAAAPLPCPARAAMCGNCMSAAMHNKKSG